MNGRGLYRVTRPVNATAAGLATVLGYLVAGRMIGPEVLPLIATVILVTAAGNVINDYCDAEIDRVNRPDRPIPSGNVTRREALFFSLALFVLGICASLLTNILCAGIAVFNSLLLAAYAVSLKKVPLVGNLTVSYLSGSIFLFGGALAGTDGLLANLPLASITILSMLSREILKAAEDVEGDRRGGARTLPMVIGIPSSVKLSLLVTGIAGALALSPVIRGWGALYLVLMIPAILFLLHSILRSLGCTTPACIQSSRVTGKVKAGMFIALLILFLASLPVF